MTHIYPEDMEDPCDMAEVYRMMQSWRGAPRSQVPNAIRTIDMLERVIANIVLEKWELRVDMMELATDYDKLVQLSEACLTGYRQRVQNNGQKLSNRMMGVPEKKRSNGTNGLCDGHVEPRTKSVTV